MNKLEKYFNAKSMMMLHHGYAARNESMESSIYHLLNYHFHKDIAQKEYFEMMHNDREVLHTLMIL